jgi:hypothetical protein
MAAAAGFLILMYRDATAEKHRDFHNSTTQWEQIQQNMDM